MTLELIKLWFKNHDRWVNEVNRAKRLGIPWEQKDEILGVTHYTLDDLDTCAEEMAKLHRQRKQEISEILKNKSKNT